MTMPAPHKAKTASAKADDKPTAKPTRARNAESEAATKAEAKPAKKAAKAPAKKSATASVEPMENSAPASDVADETEEPVPMNRAMRRAKGKGGQQAQAYGPTRVAGSKGPAHTHRMWSNRR